VESARGAAAQSLLLRLSAAGDKRGNMAARAGLLFPYEATLRASPTRLLPAPPHARLWQHGSENAALCTARRSRKGASLKWANHLANRAPAAPKFFALRRCVVCAAACLAHRICLAKERGLSADLTETPLKPACAAGAGCDSQAARRLYYYKHLRAVASVSILASLR